MQAPARAREAPAPHGPGPRALRAGAVCYDAGRVRIHRAPAPSRLPTGWGAAVALVLLWWVMAVSSVGQKSTTFDELAHLTAGYSYWLTGDFRLHPENGNLPQRWAALPLLLGHYRFPSLAQEAWRAADVFAMGYHFFNDSEGLPRQRNERPRTRDPDDLVGKELIVGQSPREVPHAQEYGGDGNGHHRDRWGESGLPPRSAHGRLGHDAGSSGGSPHASAVLRGQADPAPPCCLDRTDPDRASVARGRGATVGHPGSRARLRRAHRAKSVR